MDGVNLPGPSKNAGSPIHDVDSSRHAWECINLIQPHLSGGQSTPFRHQPCISFDSIRKDNPLLPASFPGGLQHRPGTCSRRTPHCGPNAKRPPHGAEAVLRISASAVYFNWPLASIVIPPGPLFFLASFSLRVPIAFELQSFAAATSALTASALPKSTSALRR